MGLWWETRLWRSKSGPVCKEYCWWDCVAYNWVPDKVRNEMRGVLPLAFFY